MYDTPSLFYQDLLFISSKTLAVTKRKFSITKSHHVFKKSKERFILQKPFKVHYITPFFSKNFILELFLGSILPYIVSLSYSFQLKIKNKNSIYKISNLIMYFLLPFNYTLLNYL